MKRPTRAALSILACFGLLLSLATPASATRISTSQALAEEQGNEARATAEEYLAREDVQKELTSLGVDPALARLRVAAMSPSEIAELAGRIEEEPAGGSVIGVLGVTFLVLLILELVGVIDIFKKF